MDLNKLFILRKKAIIEIFLSFILAFYFYPVKFIFFPTDTSKTVWFVFLLLFLLAMIFMGSARNILYKFRKSIALLSMFLFFGVILLFVASVKNADNVTFPLYIILYFLDITLISVFLIVLFVNFKFDIHNVLSVFINVGIIQAIAMISMLLIPEWSTLYKSIVATNPLILSYYEYRYIGLTGFANYTVGIMQGVFFLIALISYYEDRYFTFGRVFVLFLIFISAMIASRSSLVLIFLCLSFFFITNMTKKYFVKNVFPWVLILFITALVLIYYIVTDEQLLSQNILLKWAFEPFYNFVNYGELRTNSSDTIEKYYFRPSDYTYYWGDWRYVNSDGSYYKHVDAGYMRLLLYMGLYISSVFYGFFVLINIFNLVVLRTMNAASIKNLDVLFLCVLFSFFIFQYKGNIFVDGFGVLKVITIILFVNHSKNILWSKSWSQKSC